MSRLVEMPREMDAATMKAFRPVCEELASCEEDVTLDMSNVVFLDSSGIGAIMYIYKRLTGSGWKLSLQGATGQPLQLFTYLRLDNLLIN